MNKDLAYLQHILDAIIKIESYISVGQDQFMTASLWQDAVIRELEIVGEATKRISENLKSAHPDIPWRRIAGLRDILIHNYMGVDLLAVWEVTQRHLPFIKKRIEEILKLERK